MVRIVKLLFSVIYLSTEIRKPVLTIEFAEEMGLFWHINALYNIYANIICFTLYAPTSKPLVA